MKILGIETSCDETSVALLEVRPRGFVLRRHAISSQIGTHMAYGGVVPEVAARMHLEVLQPLLGAHIGKKALASVDLIAVTAGPGLITSLMVGVQAAKTLAYLMQKPLVGVNHLEGHIYAAWLGKATLLRTKRIFPALVLIVSGGHTELVLMKRHGDYELLGRTLDDAAGEAFDKVAKILGLSYPGGPSIAKLAASGNPNAIAFPRPMLGSADCNVSFAGLKTAVLYYMEKKKTVRHRELPDIAASFQQAVVDVLIAKTKRACERFVPRSLILGGGVSANKLLRAEFEKLGSQFGMPVYLPALEYTGDNAAMIAVTGYYRRKEASRSAWRTLRFDPHLRLV